MQLRIDDRRTRYTVFLLLALTINLVDSAVMRSAVNSRQRMVIGAAASFDMIVMVGAIYYWLLVRPGIRTGWSVVPISLAGVLHAAYLYPHMAVVRTVVAGLCELALVGFVVVEVRSRIRRRPDRGEGDYLVDAINGAVRRVFILPQVAGILATEFSILYYALLSWRAVPHVPTDAQAFTIYKKSAHRDLLYGMALVSVIEMAPAHLLLHQWRPLWAWIATGASLYAAVWLIGLARSIELSPVLVGPDYVDIRYGLLFRLRIPREMIARVRRAKPEDATSAAVLPRRSEPNLSIELTAPMEAEKLFGAHKRVKRIAVAADEEGAFAEALADLLG